MNTHIFCQEIRKLSILFWWKKCLIWSYGISWFPLAYQQIRRFFHPKNAVSFLFLNKNICCGYSLEAPQRGASSEYPQHLFSRNKKNIMWIPPLICSYVWYDWYCRLLSYIVLSIIVADDILDYYAPPHPTHKVLHAFCKLWSRPTAEVPINSWYQSHPGLIICLPRASFFFFQFWNQTKVPEARSGLYREWDNSH